jgi:glycosyltransferase involved in cell wall biosynthesis
MDSIYISTVTPVFSGEEYLDKLVKKLEVLRGELIDGDFGLKLLESIFVVDGAVDQSLEVLRKLEKKYDWIRVVVLSKNYGQHPATEAGVLYSSGDWVVTIDEDLQHDVDFILKMLATAIVDTSDVVYALPVDKVHKSFFRDNASIFYKKIISILTGNKKVRFFNSFRIIRGSIARTSAAICGSDMYYDISLGWFTDSISTYELTLHDYRYSSTGSSGYTARSLLSHARRLFVSSQSGIIRIFSIIGLFSMIIGITYGIFIVINALFGQYDSFPGWSSLISSILFFGGLISSSVGILLEYTGVIMGQVQGKPTFFVVDRSKDTQLMKWANEKVN